MDPMLRCQTCRLLSRMLFAGGAVGIDMRRFARYRSSGDSCCDTVCGRASMLFDYDNTRILRPDCIDDTARGERRVHAFERMYTDSPFPFSQTVHHTTDVTAEREMRPLLGSHHWRRHRARLNVGSLSLPVLNFPLDRSPHAEIRTGPMTTTIPGTITDSCSVSPNVPSAH